jgi:hypothetical protein
MHAHTQLEKFLQILLTKVKVHLQPINFWGGTKWREGEESVLAVTHHQNTGQNKKSLKNIAKF